MLQSKSSNYNQSYPSTSNLQKDFMAMAAAMSSQEAELLNDSKSKGSMQNNYVPSKSSSMNHGSLRTSSGSNSRKKDMDKLSSGE